MLTAVPSGLVVLLPPVAGAAAQAVAGAAVLWFGLSLRRAAQDDRGGRAARVS